MSRVRMVASYMWGVTQAYIIVSLFAVFGAALLPFITFVYQKYIPGFPS